MAIVVAVSDNSEGTAALYAAISEARRFDTNLVVINLALHDLDVAELPTDVPIEVIERIGRDDRDPVQAVFDELAAHEVSRLVLGIRHRSRVGKALLGSVTQRLILDSPVPVLAVQAEHRQL
ncbi:MULTISPECIES: universal stress protein [Rhodococcus]|uniref:Universal stress protein n=1 Tax=Rhodococcus jostii (strain RHA1) TaxID=101510 RepID=Q0SCD4_RHOJR|nr:MULTISPECIES: universal stress protein [Rhodococcus]ABG94802.1 universal stress protein [Rhodococcus jostii RHA1]